MGTYEGLILVQRFPVGPVFHQQTRLRHIMDNPYRLQNYLATHQKLFKEPKWVIFGLWSYDSNGKVLMKCLNSGGKELEYNSSSLDDKFKKVLKEKWPSLSITGDEEEDWKIDYQDYGSCITEKTLSYFTKGLEFFKKNDVGIILNNFDINPGKSYDIHHIVYAVTFAVGKKIYLRCIQSLVDDEQYLLEIQICYNSKNVTVNCNHEQEYNLQDCDIEQYLHYPDVPTGYF